MPQDVPEDLMKALIAKLYATITGDNPEIKIPRNKFVSWVIPGVPFLPEDFKFCAEGLVADTKHAAEDTRQRYHQAWMISKLFNFIPDVSNPFMDGQMQQTMFSSTQDELSSIYSDVLKYSKVVDLPLSDKEKAKLERFNKMLTVTKEWVNPLSDEKEMLEVPGPLVLAYNAKMQQYNDAADELMNLVTDAQAAKGSDEEAVRRVVAYGNKFKYIKSKLEAAWMAWITEGHKNEYEQIAAYIEQVTQKSMVLYKEELQRNLEYSLLHIVH